MENYIEQVFQFARQLNKKYYDLFERDILLTTNNYNEWGFAKKRIISKKNANIIISSNNIN